MAYNPNGTLQKYTSGSSSTYQDFLTKDQAALKARQAQGGQTQQLLSQQGLGDTWKKYFDNSPYGQMGQGAQNALNEYSQITSKPIQYSGKQWGQQTQPAQTQQTAQTTQQPAAQQTTAQPHQTATVMTPTQYMELAKQFSGLFDTAAQEQAARNNFAQNMQTMQGDWASRGLGASGAAAAAEGQAAADLATNLAQLKSQSMEKAMPFAMQYADQQQQADQFAKTFGLQQNQFDWQKGQQEWQNQFDVEKFDWQKEYEKTSLELQRQGISASAANAAAGNAIAQAQLDMQQKNAALNQRLQEAELTGTYNGVQTLEAQQQAFNQALQVAQLTGYVPDALLSGMSDAQKATIQTVAANKRSGA
jgi:diphthamide synthase (EF-2-diphthine--ammonia ligase)